MESLNLNFPIDLVKKEQRIVVGIATADNIDKAGDIVDFTASLEAFKNWAGNVREMHAPIAVGKAINYEPVQIQGEDGAVYNAIRVEAYISKGAQDTWEKVLDGTLRAFSIGGSIVEKSVDSTRMFRGKPVNIIKKYRLGELSLVDNPANPIASVDIIKMDIDGNLEYALEEMLNKAKKQRLKDPKGGLTAAGRRHYKRTEGANLKPGVKGKADTPEKMRRKGSFLVRFFTNPSGPMKDEKGRPTRLALSAAAWGEPVPQDRQDAAALAAKGRRLLERYAKLKEKKSNKFVDEILEEDNDFLIKQMEYFESLSYSDFFQEIEIVEENADSVFKSLTEWFKEDWVDISRPKPGGGFEPCGRPDADKGKYPKCVPAAKAAKMTQAEIDSAVRRKRTAESSTRRKDKKPNYVSTDMDKAESANVPANPELYARVKAEAKAKFKVYPSAYANAWLVREYKKRGGTYKMAKEDDANIDLTIPESVQKMAQIGIEQRIEHGRGGTSVGLSAARELASGGVASPDLVRKVARYFMMHEPNFNVGETDPVQEDSLSNDRIALNLWGGMPGWVWARTKVRQLENCIKLYPSADLNKSCECECGICNDYDNMEEIRIMEKLLDDPEVTPETVEDILSFVESEISSVNKSTETVDISLQNEDNYAKVSEMDTSAEQKLSLLKRFIGWLTFEEGLQYDDDDADVEKSITNEIASTESQVEAEDQTMEDQMDIDMIKDALGSVIDQKLTDFAASLKEEVRSDVETKIDEVTKSFEESRNELAEKLAAAETALAEQTAKVDSFADAGAVKKSVDPEDDDEELVKSAPTQRSFWGNVYLPEGVIKTLGYES